MMARDLPAALRWLRRAANLSPDDATVRLCLASTLLQSGDPAAATDLLSAMLPDHDIREVHIALTAALHLSGRNAEAAAAFAALLARFALPDDPTIAVFGHAYGSDGWCAVRPNRTVATSIPATLRVDGQPWRGGVLPPAAQILTVTKAGRHLLGSPLNLARIFRTEGIVAAVAGAIEGWAWHPGNPGADPEIVVTDLRDPQHTLRLVATDTGMLAPMPLAHARQFRVLPELLANFAGPVRVTGADGANLLGSPLDPSLEQRSAMQAARMIAGHTAPPPPLLSVQADIMGPPARAQPAPDRPVAIVVPVYRGLDTTRACLDSLLASVPPGTVVIAVDDASPEPTLAAALDSLRATGAIALVRNPANLGFPGAVNAGLRAALALPERHDVVLLNSDTLTPPGWLEALRAAVHASPDIGTATPLSNDATIVSYPNPRGGNPPPDLPGTRRLAALAARANPGVTVDLPTAIGFCMYIRAECLADTGMMREDLFAQGYGEENDFCLRARHLGWRHVAVPAAYVAHIGGQSFGGARAHLIRRNTAILERLHPGYGDLISRFVAEDPLAPHRRRLDVLRWRAARLQKAGAQAASAIFITHDSGGGVERTVKRRSDALRAAGMRPIVLRPRKRRDAPDHTYDVGHCLVSDGILDTPNLRFHLPAELPDLIRLLRGDKPAYAELHHLLGHHPSVTEIATRLGIPNEVHVHDYAAFCPRVSLVNGDGRYCGEPTDIAVCEACVADAGSALPEDISPGELRARSTRLLAAARAVIVPTADTAARIRRHFPSVSPRVSPWEDDARPEPAIAIPPDGEVRIGIIGGINVQKGYDILLACGRDAIARGLALRFTVLGQTIDDARLLQTGAIFVTGPYKEADAIASARAMRAHLGFLPSISPETWCFTLGVAWRAGLRVAAFDIGAQAERIRATGRGIVLPLGLPPPAINNALLAAAATRGQ